MGNSINEGNKKQITMERVKSPTQKREGKKGKKKREMSKAAKKRERENGAEKCGAKKRR